MYVIGLLWLFWKIRTINLFFCNKFKSIYIFYFNNFYSNVYCCCIQII